MEIKSLNLYGKQGYHFLDDKGYGLFAYRAEARGSILVERIYRGKFKGKEGIFSTPRGRGKFASIEIPVQWIPDALKLITLLGEKTGAAKEVGVKDDVFKYGV